MKYFADNSFC